MDNNDQHKITYFADSVIKETTLPRRFTFPFYYEPHPLTILAATELQQYLETHTGLGHNFGLTNDKETMAIGKMFGVLVVADTEGKIGYLSAFSGKLADSNDHPKFVPPVFDMLTEDSFFLKEQEVIDSVNAQLEEVESNEDYHQLRRELEELSAQSMEEIAAFKNELKTNKENRRLRREENSTNPDPHDFEMAEADLSKQSHYDRHRLRLLTAKWKEVLEDTRTRLAQFEDRIDALRSERKERSAALQLQLFEQYLFLNKDGKSKSLQDIFSATAFGRPPAAAGECATPKLLQYAFAQGYHPLAMAEFWWGAAPRSEIRKHKQFYPACAGKCKPILAHMLEGMPLDENPFLQAAEGNSGLEIVFEDDYLLVVNKSAGLRSVPGVDISDSVYSRLKSTLANTEPLMVHRLDMGTSGLLVVAKTRGAHKHIQKQFLDRVVSKRYTALLSKAIDQTEGEISLPLCPDPFNRPRQMVCFETGKTSITKWKVVATIGEVTKVHFWPLTGRTHQLRMHAAHEMGLNAPIVGDDIYGNAGTRLYLHAAQLSFIHPKTKERISFEVAEDF
ncbi:MAG: RNA pseudouridine synthase [Taibaiella sp.]|nr:RNA pseudouridine synthase [Taibaiella sp.]